jgi:hypothetical protein
MNYLIDNPHAHPRRHRLCHQPHFQMWNEATELAQGQDGAQLSCQASGLACALPTHRLCLSFQTSLVSRADIGVHGVGRSCKRPPHPGAPPCWPPLAFKANFEMVPVKLQMDAWKGKACICPLALSREQSLELAGQLQG